MRQITILLARGESEDSEDIEEDDTEHRMIAD
jgi:hypothetical protein